jgi:hypothetical protein
MIRIRDEWYDQGVDVSSADLCSEHLPSDRHFCIDYPDNPRELDDEPLHRVPVFPGLPVGPRGACHCWSRQTERFNHSRQRRAGVADLVSPGNFVLVKQGMRMNIVRLSVSSGPRLTATPPRNIPLAGQPYPRRKPEELSCRPAVSPA